MTDQHAAPELRPCPFCGGEAVLEWYDQPDVKRFYWVTCTQCQVDTPTQVIDDSTPDGPIAFWNRRAEPAKLREAGQRPFAVEVQPPSHVLEQIMLEMEGDYCLDTLRFVVFNDADKDEWLREAAWEPVEPVTTIHTVDAANKECLDGIQILSAFEYIEDAPRQILTVFEDFDAIEASVYLPDNYRLCRRVVGQDESDS